MKKELFKVFSIFFLIISLCFIVKKSYAKFMYEKKINAIVIKINSNNLEWENKK